MIIIEKSLKSDLEKAKKLLSENDLPIEDIEESTIQLFTAKEDNNIVGIIGLEQYNKTGLLRSFAVRDNYKNLKIGRNLLEHLFEYCKNNSISDLYLLTTTAEKYFEKFIFFKIDRENTPTIIKNTKEFSSICPVTAIIMKKNLFN